MDNEWYDEHYIGFHKVVISGQTKDDKQIEVELSKEQKEKLWDFNFRQAQDKKKFFRELLSEA